MESLRHTPVNEPPPDPLSMSGALDEFTEFVGRVEPRLRVALGATFGAVDGREALADALSWAWEHWDRVRFMDNPIGYLYRVGASAAKRGRPRPIPVRKALDPLLPDEAVSDPNVVAAIGNLSMQQRRVVMLVHAFGWSQRDVASLLDIAPSTVKQYLDRGVRRLLNELEHSDED